MWDTKSPSACRAWLVHVFLSSAHELVLHNLGFMPWLPKLGLHGLILNELDVLFLLILIAKPELSLWPELGFFREIMLNCCCHAHHGAAEFSWPVLSLGGKSESSVV
ncbi:hypothetical protein Dimus_031899 [Dionaea muscipula]